MTEPKTRDIRLRAAIICASLTVMTLLFAGLIAVCETLVSLGNTPNPLVAAFWFILGLACLFSSALSGILGVAWAIDD